MPLPTLTVDEIIATIQNSRVLNLVVEGVDDMIVYRQLEKDLNAAQKRAISTISCGGRTALLEVFQRIKNNEGLMEKCVFICDSDSWIFFGVPAEFAVDSIVKTSGYSIENDIFQDYSPSSLLVGREVAEFQSELEKFTVWFVKEINKVNLGAEAKLATHPNHVLSLSAEHFDEASLNQSETSLLQFIKQSAYARVRGKSLLALYMRQLSHPVRKPKHSATSLLEIASSIRGPMLSAIKSKVLAQIEES